MLSHKNAKGIVAEVSFTGDSSDPAQWIAPSSKDDRTAYIKYNEGGAEACRIAAAIEIQRAWRGYRTRTTLRKGTRSIKKKLISYSDIESACPHICAKYQAHLQWYQNQGLGDASTHLSLEGYAAVIIQRWWRKWLLHPNTRIIGPRPTTVKIAIKRKKKRRIRDRRDAVMIIQRAWRRHNDMKVFKFYQELINFRQSGDPALMLKSINPKEAQLLDKAAGAYVRFRLGGLKFPPNIYYKIFTRRPILDLCACSPRDYTSMANRLQQARDRNNKDLRAPDSNDQTGWYRRQENNGWRLVSDRIFLSYWQDSITTETACVKRDFHHSKLKRMQDVKRKHKQRKIEWIWKLYREGMLMAKEGTNRLQVKEAAGEIISLIEERDPEELQDKDIDDLLGWTNALNFDQYLTEWHTSASSGFSDENIHQSKDDKYEVYVTGSN